MIMLLVILLEVVGDVSAWCYLSLSFVMIKSLLFRVSIPPFSIRILYDLIPCWPIHVPSFQTFYPRTVGRTLRLCYQESPASLWSFDHNNFVIFLEALPFGVEHSVELMESVIGHWWREEFWSGDNRGVILGRCRILQTVYYAIQAMLTLDLLPSLLL